MNDFETWWKQFWVTSPTVSPSPEAKAAAIAAWDAGFTASRGPSSPSYRAALNAAGAQLRKMAIGYPGGSLHAILIHAANEVEAMPDVSSGPCDEQKLLTAVLNQARETLLVSLKGTPEALQRSLGKLNLACLAHWNWQTEKIKGLAATASPE